MLLMRLVLGFSVGFFQKAFVMSLFCFVNVAEWESPQHFQAAMRTETFEQISRKMPFTASPALYRVIAEEQKQP